MSATFRSNRRDRLADIAHLVARHDRLVIDEDAEAVLARHIGAGDDAFDAVHRFRGGSVDRDDARMRMRRAQHLHVQHARHSHVAGIFEAAGDLARRVDTADVLADEVAFLGVIFEQRMSPASVPFCTSRASSTASKIF